MRCRSWLCQLCQPGRKRRLVHLAKSGHPETFITLTVNPAQGESPEERARTLVKAWRLIVKRAKRQYGLTKLGYLCVFEATKKGEPHLHILSTVKWMDQKWLSAQMAQIANAPIVDIRKVRSVTHAARYIAKYVGKAPHRFGTCKRYWCTKGWNSDTWQPPTFGKGWSCKWTIHETTLARLQELWWLRGWQTCRRHGLLWGGDSVPP